MAGLILGGILFTGFEVPEKIPFGGKQLLAVHKLIGGYRVVDAMGNDESELIWSGRFQGPGAVLRARQLDIMRQQGAQQQLFFGGQFYTVIIQEFAADYERSYQVPYRIRCSVVSGSGADGGFIVFAATIDSLVSGDMGEMDAMLVSFQAGAFA